MTDVSTDQFDPTTPPSGPGCAECDQLGGWWFHLRRCAACGHVGCCDSSPAQHARRHFEASGHRYMQSFEPGEAWFWDFDKGDLLDGPDLAEPISHPADQSVPGPDGRVPDNWVSLLN